MLSINNNNNNSEKQNNPTPTPITSAWDSTSNEIPKYPANIELNANKHRTSINKNDANRPSESATSNTTKSIQSSNPLPSTHTLMDSVDEMDQIGNIDVFEDEEEIMGKLIKSMMIYLMNNEIVRG